MSIVKANKLIETSYRLGSREQFFVLFLISKLDSVNDKDLPVFKMHYNDIVRILNFDGKKRVANKGDVFKIMQNLNNSPIQFEDEEIREQSVWISSLRENKKENTFSFSFPPTLKPFLVQLKEQFTKYSIQNIIHLNSHAMRMYEILKKHEFEGEVVLEVESQLKKWLGIKDKYPEYFEFKRCILIKAQKELKKYTDIAFTFETARKEGRKIVALKFKIYKNDPVKKVKALDQLQSIRIEGQGKTPKNQNPKEGENKTIDSTTHKRKLTQLTWIQRKAYDLLAEKGINKAFIIDKILDHTKLKYEQLLGFEDMYIKEVWSFFKKKTTSNNLAPTFVTWWKNERLTESGLHARHLEHVMNLKRQLSGEDRELRVITKDMTLEELEEYKKNLIETKDQTDLIEDFKSKIGLSNNPSKGKQSKNKKAFDYKQFQKDFPEKYKEIYNRVVSGFKSSHKEAGFSFDQNKFDRVIQDNVRMKCEAWCGKEK